MHTIVIIDDSPLPGQQLARLCAVWPLTTPPPPAQRTPVQEKINDAQNPCLRPSPGHPNQRRSQVFPTTSCPPHPAGDTASSRGRAGTKVPSHCLVVS